MTTSTTLPPHRISHRAQGGPDLNYLYATTRYQDDELNTTDGKLNKKQAHITTNRPTQRGRKADTRSLRGTTLYLGGEEGPNGKIYCIPGHAERVLCIDTKTDEVYNIGPTFNPYGNTNNIKGKNGKKLILNGKFKWLRGITISDIIYGLPCHQDCVLRIDTKTDEVSVIDIPYEEYFDNELMVSTNNNNVKEKQTEAYKERHTPWKYHGGAISPADGCIYAIPQSAKKVLRIDPKNDRCSFVGPDLPGRCKWYGGVVGKTDGAIYGIPQNAGAVLRIDASGVNYNGTLHHDNNGLSPSSPEARVLVTTHGSYPEGIHNWHGAAASADGTIVSIPNNVDTVLCIVPALQPAYPPVTISDDDTKSTTQLPEPELYILEGQTPNDIATGRHRTDKKYKYLGAMAGTDGNVYCFPSGSERVLQVDTVNRIARSIGPNLRDAKMERLHQNKWQNGLTTKQEGCIYAIPLAAETVLRIRTGAPEGEDDNINQVVVSTWQLPEPSNVLEKWEGGVLASNGIMYCMPNNHKAVLQIVPSCLPSREALHRANDEKQKEHERLREDQQQQRQLEIAKKKAIKEKKRQTRIQKRKTERINNKKGVDSEEKKDEDATIATQESKKNAAQAQQFTANSTDVATKDGIPFKYTAGIPTLRSSAHRVKFSLSHRHTTTPNPKTSDGKLTNTTFLPADLCKEDVLAYSVDEYDFHGSVIDMLQRCDQDLVGTFRTLADGSTLTPKLDNFTVPLTTFKRKCQKGKLEERQHYLSEMVASDTQFLNLFDKFVVNKVLPHIKARLVTTGAHDNNKPITFHYQRPPTLRIQPGPARASVRAHNDAGKSAFYCFNSCVCMKSRCYYLPSFIFITRDNGSHLSEYGHQNGELNFWLPLTSRSKTGVDLWVESKHLANDYHPLKAEYGEVASFHGTTCRHYVNPNHSLWTRVSFDFRVGIEGYFDPQWQMNGTTNDHSRRKVTI